MLRVLLRHVVTEIAIKVFFDSVYDNFLKPQIKEYIRHRMLSSAWSLEPQQDVRVVHGDDVYEEMLKSIYNELYQEIRREMRQQISDDTIVYPMTWK